MAADRMPGLFDVPEVDMSRGPADVAGSRVQWDQHADAPVSGLTPAAKHASATGAQAATTWRATYAQRLLLHFSKKRRLTIAEAAVLLAIKEGSVTGPWNLLEHKLGWIVGTGEYFTYKTQDGHTVHREYHQLTPEGRSAAIALEFNKSEREAGRCSD